MYHIACRQYCKQPSSPPLAVGTDWSPIYTVSGDEIGPGPAHPLVRLGSDHNRHCD
jgi:hypothetical protein